MPRYAQDASPEPEEEPASTDGGLLAAAEEEVSQTYEFKDTAWPWSSSDSEDTEDESEDEGPCAFKAAKRSYSSARGAAEKRARYLYVHLITSQVRWQTSALFRQLVNSSSLEQHRDVYTRLIREEADPDEDRLGSVEKQEVEQGRQPPRDIFGLLEVDTDDAQGLVSPDQGSLFRIELPADDADIQQIYRKIWHHIYRA